MLSCSVFVDQLIMIMNTLYKQGKFCLTTILFLVCLNSYAQFITSKNKTILINESSLSDTLELKGYLDGENTLTRIAYTEGSELIYFGVYRGFEPMDAISIVNKGIKKIVRPRLVFNDKNNFYDIESWSNEIFKNKQSDKERLLLLRQYLINNRVHFHPSSYDDYSDYNMLLSYGYGTCDVAASNLKNIASSAGYNAKVIVMPHHVVPHIVTSTNSYILDSDIEGLYLELDNITVAGYDSIIRDKYLITRAKHYGKSVNYDKSIDSYISRLFYKTPKPYKSNKWYITNKQPIKQLNDIIIYPGGSLSFNWEDAETYFQNWYYCNSLPLLFKRYIVANGNLNYSSNFLSAPISELCDNYLNLFTNTDNTSPNIFSTSNGANFTIQFKLPFPFLKVQIIGDYRINAVEDSIELFLSFDKSKWRKVKVLNKTGAFTDTILLKDELSYEVGGGIKAPYYNYYLKFVLNSNSGSKCGLDSLYINNIFQANRFILPTLIRGVNSISYSDSNSEGTSSDIELSIKWKESRENQPPLPPSSPVFPFNGASVDSLYFGFQWLPSIDSDGDEISDYEFLLSDRSDMLYPLASNFNMYVSSVSHIIQPKFKVKETGWLNDSQTYYWKVRAKDSKGAWSEWSQVWSFTPKGVMRPINLNCSVKGDTILLNWSRNILGKEPDYYKIYWSNQFDGFTPNSSCLLDISNNESFVYVFDGKVAPRSSFRVTACTKDGQESTPSNYVNIPDLILFSYLDSISPDSLYSLKLKTINRFSPYFYYKEDTLSKVENIIYEKIPYWMFVDVDNIAKGFAPYEIARRMNFVDSLCSVSVKLVSESGEKKFDLKFVSSITNNAPFLVAGNTVAYVGKPFKSFITTIDRDIEYGDINTFKILKKPDWIDFSIIGDSILLSGTPLETNTIDNEIEVEAVDSKGLISKKKYKIKIYAISDNLLSFFPNPVENDGFIIINNEKSLNFEIVLYSIHGFNLGVIFKGFLEKGIHRIPISTNSLKVGVYILKYKTSGQLNSFGELKFIKQ